VPLAGFNTDNTGALTQLLTTWLNKKFVSDLEWSLQHQKFTLKAIIPQGSGKIGRFISFAEPPGGTSYSGTSTTALTEVFTTENAIATITAAGDEITIAEYGEFHKTADLAMYAAVTGSREKLLKRLGDGAAITVDTLVYNKAIQSTNYIYATAAATGGTTTFNTGSVTALNAMALIQAAKIMKSNKAKGFSGIAGHPDKQFAAVVSPKGELDIVSETTTGRTYWSQAVTNVPGSMGQEKWVNGYLGSIYGVATYMSQNLGTGITYTASSTGDIALVYADGGVGAMAFKDMKPEIILNDVNSPYKNVNSIAWKVFFGTVLIDTNRVVKIYHAS
jgi:N4-gp56 family major capsid protein